MRPAVRRDHACLDCNGHLDEKQPVHERVDTRLITTSRSAAIGRVAEFMDVESSFALIGDVLDFPADRHRTIAGLHEVHMTVHLSIAWIMEHGNGAYV